MTGSGGLVGSEAAVSFVEAGYDVIGVDNDMRAYFFGEAASTADQSRRLLRDYPAFHHLDLDIRDPEAMDRLIAEYARALELVVHTAAQPSHDWAASEPHIDFAVNAQGTLNLLEATRRHKPDPEFRTS